MDDAVKKKRNKKILLIASAAVVGMFLFGYALVPFYDALCNALGLNGKTSNTQSAQSQWIDKSRLVTVQFLATNNEKLLWTFRPVVKQVELHPGQNIKVAYYAKNDSKQVMTVQAIPSVTPGVAAAYLKKTECFCFNQQTLKPGQSMNMPIIFHLGNRLPKKIHELTLSYTLFKAKKIRKNKTPGRLSG